MFGSQYDKIKRWLEKTIKKSERAVDHGWEIDEIEGDENTMTIDTDQMPFKILVKVEDQLTYIALLTDIHTAGKEMENTEPVFRALLQRNKTMALSKFMLMDDTDRICLRTDLYTDHMNKKEFNMALESVILGGRWLIAQLGETEDGNRMAKDMTDLGSAELLKGTPGSEVVVKMVEAGYPEDQANILVEKLVTELGLTRENEEGEPLDSKKEKGSVDNYIW